MQEEYYVYLSVCCNSSLVTYITVRAANACIKYTEYIKSLRSGFCRGSLYTSYFFCI